MVAPAQEQSAVSRSITFRHPVRVERHRFDELVYHAVTGTPTDCVLLGLYHLMEEPPDLVVSGINRGANLGDDVLYSGTVAGAFEGAINGFPSIAVSLAERHQPDYLPAARATAELVERELWRQVPTKTVLNVNVPPGKEFGGYRITRLGHTQYEQSILRRLDPRGQEYFWVTGAIPRGDALEGTDFGAVAEGYVSITPLGMDLTAHAVMEELELWET